jgi:hypothetical protein
MLNTVSGVMRVGFGWREHLWLGGLASAPGGVLTGELQDLIENSTRATGRAQPAPLNPGCGTGQYFDRIATLIFV